mgnify:CR=1 FL=1
MEAGLDSDQRREPVAWDLLIKLTEQTGGTYHQSALRGLVETKC